jgi:hypothetical protein
MQAKKRMQIIAKLEGQAKAKKENAEEEDLFGMEE